MLKQDYRAVLDKQAWWILIKETDLNMNIFGCLPGLWQKMSQNISLYLSSKFEVQDLKAVII